MSKTELNECTSVEELEEKQKKLYAEMTKHPEREQELSQEYWTLDQQKINLYKKQNTKHSECLSISEDDIQDAVLNSDPLEDRGD